MKNLNSNHILWKLKITMTTCDILRKDFTIWRNVRRSLIKNSEFYFYANEIIWTIFQVGHFHQYIFNPYYQTNLVVFLKFLIAYLILSAVRVSRTIFNPNLEGIVNLFFSWGSGIKGRSFVVSNISSKLVDGWQITHCHLHENWTWFFQFHGIKWEN